MLATHKSQKEWLDVSQGLDAYINVWWRCAPRSGRCRGGSRTRRGGGGISHLGFARRTSDPLTEALGARALVDATV